MTSFIISGGKKNRYSVYGEDILLTKLCGRPLISYMTDKAVSAGADIIACAESCIRVLSETLPEGCGLREINTALHEFSENGDSAFFLCGDYLCGADLGTLAEIHAASGGSVTLLCLESLGKKFIGDTQSMIYISENGGNIRLSSADGNIFAGAAADRSAVKKISEHFGGKEFGAEELLSFLAESGLEISVETEDFFLAAITSARDLISAQRALMYGDIVPDRPFGKNTFFPDTTSFGKMTCDTPLYIGKNSVISDGAFLSAGSSVGDCVFIGRNARIESGIVMNGAYIGENVTVRGGVVCENARLLCGSRIMNGAVIGKNACLGENSAVFENITVGNGVNVPGETSVTEDIIYSRTDSGLVFDSDGRLCGETNGSVSPAAASAMGSAAAGMYERICIGHRENNASAALASAFSAGVSAAGGNSLSAGAVSFPELLYAVKISGCGCGCYIDSGAGTAVRLCAADGLPMDEGSRKYIENAFSSGEYRRVGYNHFGEMTSYSDIRKLYRRSLENICISPSAGLRVHLTCPDAGIYSVCSELLGERGYRRDDESDENTIVFNISGDGGRVSAYTSASGYVFHEKLVMLCIIYRMKYCGGETGVSSRIPSAADKIAEGFGKKLYRYSAFPDIRRMSAALKNREKTARKAAAATPFAEDGCAVMFTVLEFLTRENISLRKAAEMLPEYAGIERFIPMNGASDIFRRMCIPGSGGEGALSAAENESRGKVTIRPVRTGSGLMMYVESFAAETAAELCDFYEGIILKEYRSAK